MSLEICDSYHPVLFHVNIIWTSFSGYDKLKQFGFPIHGAIDGFSRRILWLQVVRSNNLPQVPARSFVNCVKEVGGCPVLLRTDGGTKNRLMANAQCFFRRDAIDQFKGRNAHRRGTSPSNQRIESWWSVFRRGSSSWWIDFFKALNSQGLLDTDNSLHKELAWYCFSSVLQSFLDEVKQHWNTHRIRRSAYSAVSGVPDVMYLLPEQFGAVQCKCPFPCHNDIAQVESECNIEESDNITSQYVNFLINNNNLVQPKNKEDAYDLYISLLQIANSN